jgi:transmembrane sensor
MKPGPDPENSAAHRAIEREAAAWVVREERGLAPAEQDALSHWLAADPRHGAALRERRWAWREFDRIAGLPAAVAAAPDPDLLAPRSAARPRGRTWLAVAAATALAAAAALAVLVSRPAPPAAPRALSTALAAPCERRVLDDGSVIELNRGARIAVEFSPALRRVRLERGEAHYVVAKDAARPFVVEAGGVTARAVGTAFNVRLAAADVEIVVTEGRVAVGSDTGGADSPPPVLEASQRAVVPLRVATPAPEIATLNNTALAARLAWQPRLLDFSDAPLGEVVATLNARNPVQLALAAPALRDLRVNASIRSDNVEGFVRLLESAFDLRAEWRSETEILLRAAR